MKLLLTSSGFATPELERELLALVGKPRGTFNSVFIPTAADLAIDRAYVDSAKGELAAVSRQVTEIDLKTADRFEINAKLSAADVVLINGGNTFYLLHHVNKSGIASALKKFILRGGVYVGVSAGAILASPTIEAAGFEGCDDPRVVELPSLEALGLVDFHIFVHDEPRWNDLVQKESVRLVGELLRIKNGEAVVVDGTSTRIAGRG